MKPRPSRRRSLTVSDAGRPRALPWFRFDDAAEDVIVESANDQVLGSVGNRPCNLVSIFGAARQGKSFLMNLLAGEEDMFRISNSRQPCTQGVDMCSHVMNLQSFAGRSTDQDLFKSEVRVGFVDAEGMGDRDVTYDARLITPVLLTSKCIIFNWKNAVQKDRILNLLGVMAVAARGIDLEGGNDGGPRKKFSHLHMVFRDWTFDPSQSSTEAEQDVWNQIFEPEPLPEEGNDAHQSGEAARNVARQELRDAFETIRVWLFPPPVDDCEGLAKEIRFAAISAGFRQKLDGLREALTAQLLVPVTWSVGGNRSGTAGGLPLTGAAIAMLMPAVAKALNEGKVLMPQSALQSMMQQTVEQIVQELSTQFEHTCDAITAKINGSTSSSGNESAAVEAGTGTSEAKPMQPGELQHLLSRASEDLVDSFNKRVGAAGVLTVGAMVVKEGMQELLGHMQRESQKLRAHNDHVGRIWEMARAKREAEQAKREAEKAKREAEQAKHEAERLRQEAQEKGARVMQEAFEKEAREKARAEQEANVRHARAVHTQTNEVVQQLLQQAAAQIDRGCAHIVRELMSRDAAANQQITVHATGARGQVATEEADWPNMHMHSEGGAGAGGGACGGEERVEAMSEEELEERLANILKKVVMRLREATANFQPEMVEVMVAVPTKAHFDRRANEVRLLRRQHVKTCLNCGRNFALCEIEEHGNGCFKRIHRPLYSSPDVRQREEGRVRAIGARRRDEGRQVANGVGNGVGNGRNGRNGVIVSGGLRAERPREEVRRVATPQDAKQRKGWDHWEAEQQQWQNYDVTDDHTMAAEPDDEISSGMCGQM
jgi:hypothetical protein